MRICIVSVLIVFLGTTSLQAAPFVAVKANSPLPDIIIQHDSKAGTGFDRKAAQEKPPYDRSPVNKVRHAAHFLQEGIRTITGKSLTIRNGRLIAGTLPLGEVYSYEGETTWKKLARLDHTPDVKYRRVWTMAEHDGQLFASTLPSGKIFAFSAGQQAMWGQPLSPGWHHVAAVKSANRLTLFVDAERVAQTPPCDAASYHADANDPLRLGTGTNGPFNGTLGDVRIYRRAIRLAEIEALAKQTPRLPNE